MNSTFAAPTLSMRNPVSCASWLWWGTFERVIVQPSGEREKNAGHPAMPTHKHAQSPTHKHTHAHTQCATQAHTPNCHRSAAATAEVLQAH